MPFSTTPVTLDGMWTTSDEWADAVEALGDKANSFFRVKHDNAFMYFLADYPEDIDLSSLDVAWVYIDTLNNGGTSPKSDDYAFQIYFESPTEPKVSMQRGTGSGWKNATPLHSGVASNKGLGDPYSSSSHMIYEFKIPNSILPSDTNSAGARFSMHEGSTDTWTVWPPEGYAARENPSLWGELDFSSPIPEFSSSLLALAIGVGLPLYRLRRYANRKDNTQSNQIEQTDGLH